MTPEQERRLEAEQQLIQRRARELHPERFAPDGSELMEWPGRDWFERLNAWNRAHGRPDLERPKPKTHAFAEPERRRNTYSDERQQTSRQEVPF